MRVKLKDFIINLAKKAGVEIDVNNAELVDFLATTTEIPQSVADDLNAKLLTLEAAIENKDVKSRIIAASMGAIDNDVKRKAEELGLTDLLTDLETTKATRDKVSKLIDKALEAERKKQGSKGADKDAYEKTISDLNNKLKQVADDFNNEKITLVETHKNTLADYALHAQLSGFDYAENVAGKDFVLSYAKTQAKQAVEKLGGKLILDESGSLRVVKADTGGELFDDKHNKVELKTLLEKSTAALLKKAEAGAGTGGKAGEIVIPAGAKTDAKAAKELSDMASQLDEA